MQVSAPVETSAGTSLPAGQKLVTVMVTIKNTGTQPLPFHLLAAVMTDQANHDYAPVSFTNGTASAGGDLSPGQTVLGELAFYLPLAAKAARFLLPPEAFGGMTAGWAA